MTTRFKMDVQGNQKLAAGLADGLQAFAELAAANARTLSPRRWRNSGRYRRSIKASTFLNGQLHAGESIRAAGFSPGAATIHSIIYTTSFLGHLLEVTGARPHDIPIPFGNGPNDVMIVKHPGFTRKPHFVPGLLQASAQAGVAIAGRQLAAHQGKALT